MSTTTAEGDRSAAVLRMEGISKRFLAVRALDNVRFDLRSGEVHAVVGENGAGKSTLMKIMGGSVQPDAGQILLDGTPVRFASPLEAKRHGIVLIHQELSPVPQLSVAENIFIGDLPRHRFGRVDRRALAHRTKVILDRLECRFSARTLVDRLSIAHKQMVEIARAFAAQAKVVIFDEPTASLTGHEKQILLRAIADLIRQGVGIAYISHRMDEIFSLSSRISVLRDGQYRGTLAKREANEAEITRLMIGRNLERPRQHRAEGAGAPVLEVRNLTCPGLFKDVSFSIRAGEIVGMYGLIGAGRSEVAETLFGLHKPSHGEVRLQGKALTGLSPRKAVQHGIALVPENRKEQGLVLILSCRDNVTLAQLDKLTVLGFLKARAEKDLHDRFARRLAIRASGPSQRAMNLSGGNQQKLVIGKWLATEPRLLILDEPTRGIDVGSKAEVHNLIRELADQRYAVLVISSEMPEVLGVSDRVLAMYSGKIVGRFKAAGLTEDRLVAALTGQGSAEACDLAQA